MQIPFIFIIFPHPFLLLANRSFAFYSCFLVTHYWLICIVRAIVTFQSASYLQKSFFKALSMALSNISTDFPFEKLSKFLFKNFGKSLFLLKMGKSETDLPIIIFPYLFHCTQILINPFLDIFFAEIYGFRDFVNWDSHFSQRKDGFFFCF